MQLPPNGRVATASFTAAAATYSANTVMGGAMKLDSFGPPGGGLALVLSTALQINTTALISGEGAYTLECYKATPPSAIADRGAFDIPAADQAFHLCSIPLGVPVDKGSTLKVEQDGANKPVNVPAGGAVFAYLVTVGGFTATAVARQVTLLLLPV